MVGIRLGNNGGLDRGLGVRFLWIRICFLGLSFLFFGSGFFYFFLG